MQYGSVEPPMPTIPGQGSSDQGRPMPGGQGPMQMSVPPPTPIPDAPEMAGSDLMGMISQLEAQSEPGESPFSAISDLLLKVLGTQAASRQGSTLPSRRTMGQSMLYQGPSAIMQRPDYGG